MTERGKFITIEGIEGSGKSTQLELLSAALEDGGFNVLATREPGGTQIGDRIRDILLDENHSEMTPETEVLLYAASRAQLVAEVIRPALGEGRHVICDRYVDSSVAYQSFGRGGDYDEIVRVNTWATGGLVPDLTLFLDVPAAVGLERATRHAIDRIESEPLEFHERVRGGYLELARRDPGRIRTVDASGSKEEIHADMLGLVRALLDGGPAT